MRLIVLILLAVFAAPVSKASTQDLLTKAIRQEMVKQNTPGVSMTVIQNGQTVYRRTFGYADREKQRLVDSSTYFHFASITKTLTALSIMQLVNSGAVSLSAPIITYLPWFKMQGDASVWKKITVGQLMSHTSGVPRDHAVDFWFNINRLSTGIAPDSAELQKGIEAQSMTFEPGTRLKYSNMGFCILGEIVAAMGGASGVTPAERYENYVREHIFVPLGMTHSSFEVRHPDQMALPYAVGKGMREILPMLSSSGAYVPAWGLVSTAGDMALYAKWVLAVSRGLPNEILPPVLLNQMTEPVMQDLTKPAFGYGLGFMTQTMPDGTKRFYHSGTYPGYRTFISFDSKNNFAVVFMSNAIDTNREAFVNLAYQALGHSWRGPRIKAQHQSAVSAPAALVSEVNHADIAGAWVNLNETFQITNQDGSLTVNEGGDAYPLTLISSDPGSQIYKLGDDGFYTGWLGEKIEFSFDSMGRPVSAMLGGAYKNFPAPISALSRSR